MPNRSRPLGLRLIFDFTYHKISHFTYSLKDIHYFKKFYLPSREKEVNLGHSTTVQRLLVRNSNQAYIYCNEV